jgi:hypothetical protein
VYFIRKVPRFLVWSRIRGTLHQDALGLVVEDDQPLLFSALQKCVETGKPQELYLRAKTADGGFRWLFGQYSYAGDKDGIPVILVHHNSDLNDKDIYRSILNHTQRKIFVCDLWTREVLYANDAARKKNPHFALGVPCFEAIYGRKQPCANCPLEKTGSSDNLVNDVLNSETGRYERRTYQKINWCGHDAFVLYLDDVTDILAKQKETEALLAINQLRIQAIQRLNGIEPLEERMNGALQTILDYYEADRVYIFRVDPTPGPSSTTFSKRCRPGSFAPQIQNLQGGRHPSRSTGGGRVFLRERAADHPRCRSDQGPATPLSTRIMTAQGITRYIEAPILSEGKLILGFIGADNPPEDKARSMGPASFSRSPSRSAALC